MSTRGRRRAPARHVAPKSPSRFLAPIALGTILVMGGSAATGATSMLANPSATSSTVASGSKPSSEVKSNSAQVVTPKVHKHAEVAPKSVKTIVVRNVSSLKTLKFGTKTIHDANIEKGTKLLRSKGQLGKIRVTYKVTFVKGKATRRTFVKQTVVSKAKDAVYIVGTGKPTVLANSLKNVAAKTGTPTGNQKYAALFVAKKYGWNSGQFSCLASLWNRESHWRHTARNRGSGAYGIPQAMPGSKMAKFGADWQTNPVTQIKWGANYIAKRYKTPCQALAHSHATGWY